jgi:uncharacterized protein (TIGR03437 family)
VCHKGTVRVPGKLLALALLLAPAWAQPAPDWRKVGPTSYEAALASPAGGPVQRVWFSPSGSTLFVLTNSGKVFQTADFEAWTPAADVTPPPEPAAAGVVGIPEPGAFAVAARDASDAFALRRNNLYRSRDGGRSWDNLTAFHSQSVIGGVQRSVAVSPADPEQLAVANDFGVWRSMDGGRTWAGLNEGLPNLPVWRILSTPTGTAGTRVQLSGGPALELPPGASTWVAQAGVPAQNEENIQALRLSMRLGLLGTAMLGPGIVDTRGVVSAFAQAGQTVYVGTADGHFKYSTDGGNTFATSGLPVGVTGRVERIYVDPAEPDVALAALSGPGIHALRTFNGGLYWDSMDNGLPDVSAWAITADRAAGAVYLGTESGVYWTTVDLLAAGAPPRWNSLTAGLPDGRVTDVKLDQAGVQLYVVSAGYGVYATAAPHRRRSVRLVSAGDFSARAAAPGSLMSVVGAKVSAARGGGFDYPVLGIPTDSESQIQVPYGASGPTVSLSLDTAAGRVTLPLQMQPVSPAIFVNRDGAPMILDGDSGMPIDGRAPAKSNGRIQIFATGLGRVQPDLPAGAMAPLKDPPVVIAPVRVYLNGNPLQVVRATLAPGNVGWYLVEAQLPVIANFGASDLYISASGQDSNHVRIVIEP